MSREVVTIEKTGKVWKFAMILSACAIGWGIYAVNQTSDEARGFGVLAIVAGSLLFVFARVGAWWCHG